MCLLFDQFRPLDMNHLPCYRVSLSDEHIMQLDSPSKNAQIELTKRAVSELTLLVAPAFMSNDHLSEYLGGENSFVRDSLSN